MARKVIKKQGLTFMGLGLDPKDETKLKRVLDAEDITGKQLVRRLVKAYIKDK